MSIRLENHSMQKLLKNEKVISNNDIRAISCGLEETSHVLVKKMKVIDHKERKSWQNPILRN